MDDLSDLSETEYDSEDDDADLVVFDSDEEEEDDERLFDEEGHFTMSHHHSRKTSTEAALQDSCVGTDDLEEYISKQQTVNIQVAAIAICRNDRSKYVAVTVVNM